ncbi:hypothetical protein SESBI_07177 [Sesbania bispinosa]|nr:hypothetical protein SESBI_07177 [Sesbania bispinosa]
MGSFVNHPKFQYKGGEVHVFHGLDIDTWSYFEVVGLLKDLGYVDKVKMSWKEKCAKFSTLKPLCDDDDAMDLSAHVVLRKCEVEIYVEHSVRVTEKVQTNPNVAANATVDKVQDAVGVTVEEEAIMQNDENESDIHESSDESVENVGQVEAALNEQMERIKENIGVDDNDVLPETNLRPEVHNVDHPVNVPEDVAGGEGQPEVFVPADVAAMHDIEDEYFFDVLDSGVDEYGSDDNGKPRCGIYGHNNRKCKYHGCDLPPKSKSKKANKKGKGVSINEQATTQPPSSTQQSVITQPQSQVMSPNRIRTQSSQSEAGPSNTKKQPTVTTRKRKNSKNVDETTNPETSAGKKKGKKVNQKPQITKVQKKKDADLPQIPTWAQNKSVAKLLGIMMNQRDVYKQASNIMMNASEATSEPDPAANDGEKPPSDAANDDGEE